MQCSVFWNFFFSSALILNNKIKVMYVKKTPRKPPDVEAYRRKGFVHNKPEGRGGGTKPFQILL